MVRKPKPPQAKDETVTLPRVELYSLLEMIQDRISGLEEEAHALRLIEGTIKRLGRKTPVVAPIKPTESPTGRVSKCVELAKLHKKG